MVEKKQAQERDPLAVLGIGSAAGAFLLWAWPACDGANYCALDQQQWFSPFRYGEIAALLLLSLIFVLLRKSKLRAVVETGLFPKEPRRVTAKQRVSSKKARKRDILSSFGFIAFVVAIAIWALPWGTCYRPAEWPDGCWSIFNDNGSMYVDKYGWFNAARLNYSFVSVFLGILAFIPRVLRSINR